MLLHNKGPLRESAPSFFVVELNQLAPDFRLFWKRMELDTTLWTKDCLSSIGLKIDYSTETGHLFDMEVPSDHRLVKNFKACIRAAINSRL
jgi:hypothetical protein